MTDAEKCDCVDCDEPAAFETEVRAGVCLVVVSMCERHGALVGRTVAVRPIAARL